MSRDRFFESSNAAALREPDALGDILDAVDPRSDIFYELTFHASFARRMLGLLQREGTVIDGIERMQSALAESFEKIRLRLEDIENHHGIDTSEFLTGSKESNARLAGLIEDLAVYKDWQVHLKDND